MNFLSKSKVYERHRKGDTRWYTTEPSLPATQNELLVFEIAR